MGQNYSAQVNLSLNADIQEANKKIKELQDNLDKLTANALGKNFTNEIKQGYEAASQLQLALSKSLNTKTGLININEFNKSLKESGYNIEKLQQGMTAFGSKGISVFGDLAEQISKSEEPIRRTSKLMDGLFKTISNSVKWQVSATVLYNMMDSISGAYQYAKDLDRSLNDIRIVSGQSTEQMAQFAEYANQAAKALSTTTTNYTDAALIYYQQGLAEEEVKKRTDLTIQMANVTGDTVSEVSDQLTAVWNNFYDGSQSLEYYVDVMTELGAATASSTDEIATGLQKFSAIADMIGLSFDYAATSLATITAVSRQSPDTVGTSLRSIFSRMQGLLMGETLEDGVDLNKYSSALQAVGINVLDANGEIRDMNSLLDEMGEKWSDLSKTQQTALAQTVAGKIKIHMLAQNSSNCGELLIA